MMTVRFPSGFSVQYNTANYVSRVGNGYTDLYTEKGGSWVAQVPTAGCIVESVPPCRTYVAASEPAQIAATFLAALEDPQQRARLSSYDLAQIKALLDGFDARRRRWK